MPRPTDPVKWVCYADDLTMGATGVKIPDAVNKAVKYQKKNIVFDDIPHPINDSEKDLTMKERATLAPLRSGYCKLLGSYKSSKIKKDSSLNVCVDCGKPPHDVKHLFACPAHPTTLIPSDL